MMVNFHPLMILSLLLVMRIFFGVLRVCRDKTFHRLASLILGQRVLVFKSLALIKASCRSMTI